MSYNPIPMKKESPLPLNVLLTKRCNFQCPFCIEDTKRTPEQSLDWRNFAAIINQMIEAELVNNVLLLGGEPMYYPGFLCLIQALEQKPIITTNGYRLVKDKEFLSQLLEVAPGIMAINISLPHYSERKRAELSGTGQSFSNEELKVAAIALRGKVSLRINTLLIDGYIDSMEEIARMIRFCEELGIEELKVGELIGRNTAIHNFLKEQTVTFNAQHYVPIPDEEAYQKCHKNGGSWPMEQSGLVQVLFNAPPDIALSGGRDENGNHYHRVLFEDGLVGYSWDREKDGVQKPELIFKN